MQHILQTDPEEFKKGILIDDGDMYQRRWRAIPGAEAWICAKCGCYKANNACKACEGSDMSGGSAAAVMALAHAAEMFDLTEGDSEADGADADNGADVVGFEMEEGPL